MFPGVRRDRPWVLASSHYDRGHSSTFSLLLTTLLAHTHQVALFSVVITT